MARRLMTWITCALCRIKPAENRGGWRRRCLQRLCQNGHVDGNGAVCDQKIPKFFVSHQEESMTGHVGVNGVY
jgi:hypothetical protein